MKFSFYVILDYNIDYLYVEWEHIEYRMVVVNKDYQKRLFKTNLDLTFPSGDPHLSCPSEQRAKQRQY